MFSGSFGTGGYMGNNRSGIREEGIKENNISSISSKLGNLCIARYYYYTHGYTPTKHTV
jgi:hypothetical protein